MVLERVLSLLPMPAGALQFCSSYLRVFLGEYGVESEHFWGRNTDASVLRRCSATTSSRIEQRHLFLAAVDAEE
jgi:hypothetical protein